MYTTGMCSVHGGQKMVLDPLKVELHTNGWEGLCGCWEMNLGPLKE